MNNDFQRNSNISSVFESIWRNPETSRVDIARKNQLYRSTVSNIIGTLLENNVIVEGEHGTVTAKGGRKPVFLSINKSFGCIVGIELQTDTYNVVAMTFDGEQIFSMRGTNAAIENSERNEESFIATVDHIIESIIPGIKQLGIPPLCICIGIPGIVDIDKGIVIRSDPFSLVSFNFSREMGNRYGIPLFMENDAKCCSWLQCALQNDQSKKDFICVLSYFGVNGMGIGLSVALNGRIMHGQNYAIGEYVSRSWNETKKGQTGLPEAVVNTIMTNDDSYREWITDLFSTLTSFVPLLGPRAIFFYGQPQKDKSYIEQVIHNEVPQFDAITQKNKTAFFIMDEDPYAIAKGAALMFLQELLIIPDVQGRDSYSHLTWDSVFDIQQKGREKDLLHVGTK